MSNEEIKDWVLLEQRVQKLSPYRSVLHTIFRMQNGVEKEFCLKKEGKVVTVCAFTQDNQVVLARQFRPGPQKILDELPAGGFDAGCDKSMEDAARRELLEETGYAPEQMIYLGRPFECAYSTIERHAYVALGAKKVADQNLDECEFIEVVLKNVPDFIAQLVKGECTDPEVGWMALFKIGYIGARELL